MASKYGKKASQKVERAMHEMKRGELKSGGSGRKVKSRKQAIAIGCRKPGGREEGPGQVELRPSLATPGARSDVEGFGEPRIEGRGSRLGLERRKTRDGDEEIGSGARSRRSTSATSCPRMSGSRESRRATSAPLQRAFSIASRPVSATSTT